MFDFDAGKLLVIGVVALIVIGPKELPRVLRQLGQTIGKLRRMATEFQSQFMDAMREAELEEIRQDMVSLSDKTKIQSTFNPIQTVRRELTDALADKTPDSQGAPRLGLEGLAATTQNAPVDFTAAGAAPITDSVPPIDDAAQDERAPLSEPEKAPAPPLEIEPPAARKIGGI